MGDDGKSLDIDIRLNKSPAKAAAEAFRADMAALNQGLAKDTQAAAAAELDAHRRAQEGRVKATEGAGAKVRDELGRFVKASDDAAAGMATSFKGAADKSIEAAGRTGGAFTGAADAGVKGFLSMGASMDLTRRGLDKLIELAGAYGRAIEQAAEKSKALSKGFVDRRDTLSELATLSGRANDSAFALDLAKFGTRTRMRPDEARAFQTELLNSGAQYKGSKISDKEFGQFAEQSGSLATALGFDRAESGNLAGTILGFEDFKKYGEQASEMATARMNEGLQVLGHGKGKQSVLMNQFSMLTSASLKEPGMQGSFSDSNDAAIALSIGAEKHDAQAAELVMMANRVFGKFEGKSREMLAAAKIDKSSTDFLTNVEKLAPVVAQMAKVQGKSEEQVLRENIEDIGSAEAMAVFLNKGVEQGGFAERRAFAATVKGPEKAFATIDKFKASDVGVTRLRDAQIEQAAAERGAGNARIETLRREAIGQMMKRGELDSTDKLFQDYMTQSLSFGMLPEPKQQRIDEVVENNLRKRLPKAARHFRIGLPLSTEAREGLFNEQIAEIERGGVNPLTGGQVTENPLTNGMDVSKRKLRVVIPPSLLTPTAKIPPAPELAPLRKPAPPVADLGPLGGTEPHAPETRVSPGGIPYADTSALRERLPMHITPGWTPTAAEADLGAGPRKPTPLELQELAVGGNPFSRGVDALPVSTAFDRPRKKGPAKPRVLPAGIAAMMEGLAGATGESEGEGFASVPAVPAVPAGLAAMMEGLEGGTARGPEFSAEAGDTGPAFDVNSLLPKELQTPPPPLSPKRPSRFDLDIFGGDHELADSGPVPYSERLGPNKPKVEGEPTFAQVRAAGTAGGPGGAGTKGIEERLDKILVALERRDAPRGPLVTRPPTLTR